MVLVQCDMCREILTMNNWKEGHIFICIKCVKVLQKIKKKEIKLKHIYSDKSRMKIFHTLRFKEVS